MSNCSRDCLGNGVGHCANEVPRRADREWVRGLAKKLAAVANGVRSQAHNQDRYGQWFASETVEALESKAFANRHPVSWRSKIIASKGGLKWRGKREGERERCRETSVSRPAVAAQIIGWRQLLSIFTSKMSYHNVKENFLMSMERYGNQMYVTEHCDG